MIVKKQKTRVSGFRLVSGATLPDFDAGYETYGELNQDKSNVILVCHGFPGTSHAAGKYTENDPAPGYWDALIGPGKPLDTEKYFVVSVDSICNLMCHNPMVHTIGPANADQTLFEHLEVCDFVELQSRVLASLGIEHLYCVAGASMGSSQAFEWAVRYPNRVQKVIAGLPIWSCSPYLAAMIHRWTLPVASEHPNLSAAFQTLLLDVIGREQFDSLELSQESSQAARKELADLWTRWSTPETLQTLAATVMRFRAGYGKTEDESLSNLTMPVLLYSSRQDLLVSPDMVDGLLEKFSNQEINFEHHILPSHGGHIDGVSPAVAALSAQLNTFLCDP